MTITIIAVIIGWLAISYLNYRVLTASQKLMFGQLTRGDQIFCASLSLLGPAAIPIMLSELPSVSKRLKAFMDKQVWP